MFCMADVVSLVMVTLNVMALSQTVMEPGVLVSMRKFCACAVVHEVNANRKQRSTTILFNTNVW